MPNPLDRSAQETLGGMVRIGRVITQGSPATIRFASIPQTFSNLKLFLYGRDTSTGVSDSAVRIKINGDGTSGNYQTSIYLYNANNTTAAVTTSAASAAGATICAIPGSSSQANAVGSAEIFIPCYFNPAFYKIIQCTNVEFSGSVTNLFNMQISTTWKSTAPITDIVLTAGTTAFVDGTTAILYGLL